MDLSLDDYMRTKKRSYPPGGSSRGRGNARAGAARGTNSRSFGNPMNRRNPLAVNSGGIRPKASVSVLSRLGNSGKKMNESKPAVGTKVLAMDSEPQKQHKSTGSFKVMISDARSRIGNKSSVDDARMRIKMTTGLSVADARQKIKSKKADSIIQPIHIQQTVADEVKEWSSTTLGSERFARISDGSSNIKLRIGEVGTGITRTVNQEISRPFDDNTDLTIVRNFRPSLSSFSAADGTYDAGARTARDLEVRISRKVPGAQVYTLPDYADLLKDTKKKLEAGHGDLYYGKMQADQEATALYSKVMKVQSMRTVPVEAPVITINNDKLHTAPKVDPPGIIAIPKTRKYESQINALNTTGAEPMDTDSTPVDIISPLQGFKVTVTNLRSSVTQDDIIELFASIGALKKARLLKKGCAEVVYVKEEDAHTAVKVYHNRLLDNMPMHVKCVSNSSQKAPIQAPVLPVSGPSKSKQPIDLDIDVVHKALFRNNKEQGTATQPVQFLVKI